VANSTATLVCTNRKGRSGSLFLVDSCSFCANFSPKKGFRSDIKQPQNPLIRIIPLTQNKVTIVDADIYDQLIKFKWYATRKRNGFYACRRCKKLNVYMHRFIMNPSTGFVVDHIDHNPLNNTRKNLRNCSVSQNSHNRRPRFATSSFKGVQWHKKTHRWLARISRGGRIIESCSFSDEVQAARAYDRMAKKHFGRFAYLNFPDK